MMPNKPISASRKKYLEKLRTSKVKWELFKPGEYEAMRKEIEDRLASYEKPRNIKKPK